MSRLSLLSAWVFVAATLGTGLYDLAALLLGGYEASVTAVVRGWCQRWPWLRPVGVALCAWLAYHLFVEEAPRVPPRL